MEREILNALKFRSLLQITRVCPVRFCSNVPQRPTPRSIKTRDEDYDLVLKKHSSDMLRVQHWNEFAAIRKEKRENGTIRSMKSFVDMMKFFQSWNNFPTSVTELLYYFKRRWVRKQLIEQNYLPRRVAVLKPDLAAAHFLLRRGGHVKFLGSEEWFGYKGERKKLPLTYIPGMLIEAIDAEGTNLFFEGLANLNNLRYLTSLSLKNLTTMNDWCMDYISQQHYQNLKHLDISGCKNITFRGLSCFYRFECLETLNLEGIPDSPELKLACLMLLEIMPNLEIKGINLDIPEKIEAVIPKELPQNTKAEISA